MENNCETCGCGSDKNCAGHKKDDLSREKAEKIIAEKNKHRRKYNVEYRIDLNEMDCSEKEFIERVKAYAGIVDEIEFTEEELIISYDDRLINSAEISDLVN